MEHWIIFASGNVQGVGYRANAKQHAQSLNILGYAKNLLDGRVKVEAVGTQHDLAVLCEHLQSYPHDMSTALDILNVDTPQSFIDFQIY